MGARNWSAWRASFGTSSTTSTLGGGACISQVRDALDADTIAPAVYLWVAGGPPGTRTRNLRIKSPLLYPIELEARGREYTKLMLLDRGVTEGTRTPNPQDHNLAL